MDKSDENYRFSTEWNLLMDKIIKISTKIIVCVNNY